jgi:hypothetical protein
MEVWWTETRDLVRASPGRLPWQPTALWASPPLPGRGINQSRSVFGSGALLPADTWAETNARSFAGGSDLQAERHFECRDDH